MDGQVVAANETGAVAPDPMVIMVERLVLNPDVDADKLERMLAIRERLEAQNAKVAFATALAAARAEIPPIVKDATVDFTSQKGRTHYQHETLAGIAKAIDPVLSRHGLSYRFRTDQGNGGVRVTCIIAHAAGHSEETSLAASPDGSGSKNAFQAIGSAVTYLQRYTLKAALGLSAEVDDDGQAAAPCHDDPRQQQRREPAQQPPEDARQITEDEYRALRRKAEEAGVKEGMIAATYGVRQLAEMTVEQFGSAMRKLDTTIANRKPAAAISDDEIPY